MKILMINVVCGIRSTGCICTNLAEELEKQGHQVKIAYGREEVPPKYQKWAIRIGSNLDVGLHGIKARFFDAVGLGSKKATKRFVEWMKEYDPDVIHLHNLHGYYINIEVLFDYLRNCGKKIIWTLHDCWAFTGHCTYFDYENCEKWKMACEKCPKSNDYPKRWVMDNSRKNYNLKKKILTQIPNMRIITPSQWLTNLVKQSFLKEYAVQVIYNGIDTTIFKPTDSELRKKYNLEDKKVILGVSAVWEKRKGLDVFNELADMLPNDYRIVLIGIPRSLKKKLAKNIIAIPRTNNQKELAEFYTMADVYLNPTYEDNYPTTNLEAIACGTPVITYNTGGSGESAILYGCVVNEKNVDSIRAGIGNIRDFTINGKVFDIKEMVEEYIKAYFYM
ncbi:glycosyltransferase [Clostridiaceae bacterium]|nr:glycosyltransferase [Clostridiaceae bacterium]RKI12935.1 glycosyltransferase [bacterium 1XD21-70]